IRSEARSSVRGSGFIPTFRTCRAEARPTVLAAASGEWSPPASSDGVAITVRRQADVFQQLGGELLGELLGAEAGGLQVHLGRLGGFVRRVDAGEVADLAGACLAVQALG